MSFSLDGTGHSSFGGAVEALVRNDLDLEEIQTDALGFLSLSGEAKVQLLPSSWPFNKLPPPTASLLSIASQRGLIAAAGPDTVIVATTESVRKAFEAPKSGDNEIRPFQPQLALQMPMRLSQVTFTADENYLVLSAEVGGGLAVYDVPALLNGSTQRAFEMRTNSSSLRALVPNPTPEKGELLAAVTTDGKLMMANLKEKNLISGVNGQILKESVSCVSWSTKGKQLVAGLGDGSAYQMTPEGQGRAMIPRPPNVGSNHHVSSITWLENNVFLIVHTPSTLDPESAPASTFHVVTRQPPSEYVFQRIGDPTTPYGLNRSPPHHFLIRLRDFPPNLQDLLIVASSASTDIGLFTRSKAPLISSKAADRITGVFTMTEMSDDSRRAQLPMTEDMIDTSPIGVGLDLSSRDKVIKPIAGDEMEGSLTPVPALMVLNNEGILASWWVIYTESIKQGTAYPGLIGASSLQQPTQAVSTQQNQPPSGVVTKLGFEQPSFGTPSGLGITAFGAASGLHKAPSPWATSAANNTMSSGNTLGTSNAGPTAPSATQGISFGNSAFPGSRNSPWATGSTKVTSTTFGQPGGLGMGVTPLGMTLNRSANNTGVPSSGGFASFANQSGFPTITSSQANTTSIFGSKQQISGPAAPSTGTTTSQADNGGIFGLKPQMGGSIAPSTTTSLENGFSFGSTNPKTVEKPMSLLGSAGFTLGSTFKPDESTKDNYVGPPIGGGISFGSNFGTAVADAQKATIASTLELTRAGVDEGEPNEILQLAGKETGFSKRQVDSSKVPASTTPMSTPSTLKFQFPNPVPPVKGKPFGTLVESPSTDVHVEKTIGLSPRTSNSTSGNNPRISPAATPALHPSTPKKAQVSQSDEKPENALTRIPEPPLPPDPTSKTSYTAGESSVSSTEPDAPLPPDFLSQGPLSKTEALKWPSAGIKNKDSITPDLPIPNDTPGGPEGEEDSDFETEEDQSDNQSEEGSGEDIAKDVSPVSDSQQTPGITPQSSFGGAHSAGDSSSLFTKISQPVQDRKPRSLFGEIGTKIKLPPPPKQLSPRSPSPVRTSIPSKHRPEASRSVSAPGVASQLLSSRRLAVSRLPHTSSSSFAILLEQKRAETRRQEEIKARKVADESQALIDEEDDTIQRFLQQDIIGSKILDDFIAHQDYVGNADKDSIPAQVEAVYRDVNSMIDTLGINSRALKSFIKGHTEQCKKTRRNTEDLEGDEEWCLAEIESLSSVIEEDLQEELDHGQIKDVIDKLHICADLERDLVKLRAKHDDIKALLTSRLDPDRLIIVQSLPLSAEQTAQQHDLRRDFANFRKLLSEAEEGLVLLRTKLASHTGVSRKVAAGPTVEAVVRTIMKMTSMAEKRSGDIDVLENQMRKIRFSSTISSTSREDSPFTTPVKSSIRNQGTPSTHGQFYTPDSIKGTPRGIRTSLISSTHSYGHGTPPRKKMSSFTDEEKHRLKTYALRRKEVTDKLNATLQKSGTRILLMDDP